MIGRLTGTLVECSPGEVLVDVGGVGYRVRIPLSTFYRLSERAAALVTLHVHTHVREDALQLFGFSTPEERSSFEQLIAVSGVGPRMALAVLSGIGIEDLRRALLEADRGRLERIPGIGRKTAERILLELRGRLDREAHHPGRRAGEALREGAQEAAGARGVRADALSALVNLGYSAETAEKAIGAAIADAGEEEGPVESLLKGALRHLLR